MTGMKEMVVNSSMRQSMSPSIHRCVLGEGWRYGHILGSSEVYSGDLAPRKPDNLHEKKNDYELHKPSIKFSPPPEQAKRGNGEVMGTS